MKILHTDELKNKIKEYKTKIENLEMHLNKKLALSPVYTNGCVYGIAYDDGHGTIELLETLDNVPERLLDYCEKEAKNFLNGTLYVVALKPEKIEYVIN